MLSPAQFFVVLSAPRLCFVQSRVSVFGNQGNFPGVGSVFVIHNCGCNDAFGELKSVFTTNLV